MDRYPPPQNKMQETKIAPVISDPVAINYLPFIICDSALLRVTLRVDNMGHSREEVASRLTGWVSRKLLYHAQN